MKLGSKSVFAIASGFALLTGAAPLQAVISYDADVTPDAIFGGGNANGSYTVDRANGIELGLRGKLRFDENNSPQNIFNSNGDGSYKFKAGLPPTGFGFAANSPTTPVWNFEWSINSDYDDPTYSGNDLDDLIYQLTLDFDPGPGTTPNLTFDPIHDINPNFGDVRWDHSIGNNDTGNGGGAEDTSSVAAYDALITANNVAQNSWSMEFFNESPYDIFNPKTPGVYTFSLSAYDPADTGYTTPLASTSIDIIVCAPEPVTASLGLMGMGALGFMTRRRSR